MGVPRTVMPLGCHTSGPTSSTLAGCNWDLFHTRVFSSCSLKEQEWHQQVSLLSAFSLRDCPALSLVVKPQMRGRACVRQPHERQQRLCVSHPDQPDQHGRPEHVVVRPNAFNFQDSRGGVPVCDCPKHVPRGIRSGSGGERILERRTLILKVLHELLRECPSNDAPQRGAGGDAPHSAVFASILRSRSLEGLSLVPSFSVIRSITRMCWSAPNSTFKCS